MSTPSQKLKALHTALQAFSKSKDKPEGTARAKIVCCGRLFKRPYALLNRVKEVILSHWARNDVMIIPFLDASYRSARDRFQL